MSVAVTSESTHAFDPGLGHGTEPDLKKNKRTRGNLLFVFFCPDRIRIFKPIFYAVVYEKSRRLLLPRFQQEKIYFDLFQKLKKHLEEILPS